MSVNVQSIRESCIIWGWGGLNLRKYNNFAPIGLKSGFVIGMIQFDIEISLICGFAPQMGDKKPCVLGGVGDRIEIRDPRRGDENSLN